jgi:hypothetical protein
MAFFEMDTGDGRVVENENISHLEKHSFYFIKVLS